MNKLILSASLSLACVATGYSQETATRSRTTANGNTSVSANQTDKTIAVADGTRVAGELQNSIDVRKAKVGDEVVLKTTEAIKSEGRIVVNKGARLFGRVTEVSQKTKENGQSRLGILFDRLESDSLEVPIVASIVSVVNGHAGARNNNQDVFSSDASSSSSTTTSAQRGGQGGGSLLGGGVVSGTTSTAGNVLGSTTSAVGSTVSSAANSAGAIASGPGRSIGRIQISESTDASVASGSVLSLRGDNLHLEKGTTFNLVLSQSANTTKN